MTNTVIKDATTQFLIKHIQFNSNDVQKYIEQGHGTAK